MFGAARAFHSLRTFHSLRIGPPHPQQRVQAAIFLSPQSAARIVRRALRLPNVSEATLRALAKQFHPRTRRLRNLSFAERFATRLPLGDDDRERNHLSDRPYRRDIGHPVVFRPPLG